MEDDQNRRRPKWNTTKMKMTKIEDDQKGRQPKWKTANMEFKLFLIGPSTD